VHIAHDDSNRQNTPVTPSGAPGNGYATGIPPVVTGDDATE